MNKSVTRKPRHKKDHGFINLELILQIHENDENYELYKTMTNKDIWEHYKWNDSSPDVLREIHEKEYFI